MKLSPAKIEDISERLIDQLAEIDGVLFQAEDGAIRIAMRDIITDELMIEEKLDAEVHKMLQAYKYEITMGRMSYDDLFKKIRSRLILERKIVL
ncbi:DUF507 family protein [Chloroflexia bacterium SDU3-3]|nr:DUF507 family protein [Chloroflexia bacterium SDU3-3]